MRERIRSRWRFIGTCICLRDRGALRGSSEEWFSVALRIAIGGVGSASTNGHVTASGCVLDHGLWDEA